ncbi:tRNA lysidine(34) synthetase TilS [Defluviimonas sp. WL0002]|uniref:tRNA(Ile)-lysidine synthase n=1 Tax=Albidovulum marisflavi TaxID=2984159 RepID=A0ABT2ZA57_9RHOB|nr:tRNA lysidine(34) synthetase TilS [Defluviimonas sp. WL0002]MCV2867963.1 tRNA lysidine(34) synthetase TilS [Defluviimonas sp. WL0002]
MTATVHPKDALRDFFAPGRPDRLGVAVSGGGDSTALLCLLADLRAEGGPKLAAVTVDHTLRPESAQEAALVAALCAQLGVDHATLRWTGWDGRGNLSDAARRARQALIANWARDSEIGTVALAHTSDDQAETFLLRLARGSGVDGLSGMAPRRRSHGIEWVRPLLGVRRQALRDDLSARGVGWVEDPTNADERYDRVRARKALDLLAPLGLTVPRLTETAGRMARARSALDSAVADLARVACTIEAGDVVIARDGFDAAPEEVRLRLLAHAVRFVASAEYRPRFEPLTEAAAALARGGRRTLAGTLLSATGRAYRVAREHRAVAGLTVPVGEVWDGRWRMAGPALQGAEIRALGPEGMAQLDDPRASGLPYATLVASPAVWSGARLVAAPIALFGSNWRAEPLFSVQSFISSIFAH